MMVRKLGILLGLIVLGLGAGALWFWRQATTLPDWYTQKPLQQVPAPVLTGTDIDEPQEIAAMRAELEQKVGRSLTPLTQIARASVGAGNPAASPTTHKNRRADNTHTVELDANSFSELVITSIPQTKDSRTLLTAVKAINTEIVDGELKTGLIIAPNDIPWDELPQQYQKSLAKAFQTFPFLKQKEVYIGVVGQPRLAAGRVVLDDQTQVQVGSIKFPLVDVTNQLGLSLKTLEQQINLQVGQLKVKDINFSEQKAILQGAIDSARLPGKN